MKRLVSSVLVAGLLLAFVATAIAASSQPRKEGGNFGFLGVQATNCPQPLPANKKCWLDVWFVPQDKINNPPKMSTLTIFDNATNAPQSFTLMGTGK